MEELKLITNVDEITPDVKAEIESMKDNNENNSEGSK